MKVFCKCCHKGFDYDMYMGLCPRCGRVYRRGAGMLSQIERDMAGEFHIEGKEGGLNRGIDGVVYNQASASAKKILNNDIKAVPVSEPMIGNAVNSNDTVIISKALNSAINSRQGYYSPNHPTKMNQGVNPQNNNAGALITIIFVIIFIMAFLMSMFN